MVRLNPHVVGVTIIQFTVVLPCVPVFRIRGKCLEFLLELIDKVQSDIQVEIIPSGIVALSKHLMHCCQKVVQSIDPNSLDSNLEVFLRTLVSHLRTFLSCATASSEVRREERL